MSWPRISSTVGGSMGSIGGFSTSLEAITSVVLGVRKGEIFGSVKKGGVLGSTP
ncbi:hypothetical protein D8674_002913 [Pyrus ussuriensis x Pyrus communis]|uniref:Uncharacterized protein n=1 Tax=Pyrus ussuriensis x Pyrus communis TaxID=2448454 RepID=A0A5N5FFL2_9ROSA|nr:hypothetical protein D8674_002913 [Pyrus ussuriensis x Pyrus communis]